MKIILFGASGGTGRHILSQGLSEDHTITAFVRDVSRIPFHNKNLTTIQGNILDKKEVVEAIAGHDVVISVLGNKTSDVFWKSNTIISQAIEHILAGMKKYHVKRLLFVTTFAVNDQIFLPEKILIRTLLKNIFADIPRQEALIKKSDNDWTIIHPARLVNEKEKREYCASEQIPIGMFSKIARIDVADFILNNLTTKNYLHKTVTISY